MTNKEQRLVEKCVDIEPLGYKILVAPHKLRTYKEKQMVLDDEANKGKDPIKDEMVQKEEIRDLSYRYQKATVLRSGRSPQDELFEVGEVIVYGIGDLIEFDLIKGISILPTHAVVARIK
jgi:hypothetical protein